MVQRLAEEEIAMRKQGLNEKHMRMKTVRRRKWAMCLIRPATLKAVITVGRIVAQVLQIVLAIIKVFRQ